MELDDVPRPLSVPLPDYANEDRAVGRPTTAMSSIVFPDYEEINDEFITKKWGSKSKENLPWSILNTDQAEEKIKIPWISLINLNVHIEKDKRVNNTQLYHHQYMELLHKDLLWHQIEVWIRDISEH